VLGARQVIQFVAKDAVPASGEKVKKKFRGRQQQDDGGP
jgi:hypothetical protein